MDDGGQRFTEVGKMLVVMVNWMDGFVHMYREILEPQTEGQMEELWRDR